MSGGIDPGSENLGKLEQNAKKYSKLACIPAVTCQNKTEFGHYNPDDNDV
jgi:hypothetical protein